jgi:hypothetical protein
MKTTIEKTAGSDCQQRLVRLCEFVIIVGGLATGKTLNKASLKKHFKCEECYDCPGEEFDLSQSEADRMLILTWDADVKDPRHDGKRKPRMDGLRVTVEEARMALGDQWVEPNAHKNNLK